MILKYSTEELEKEIKNTIDWAKDQDDQILKKRLMIFLLKEQLLFLKMMNHQKKQ